MLLETLDIKNNDIVIYSNNTFDFDNNYKIIYKDDPLRERKKITYGEVCRFVNEYTPKNLIVYRLLTNIRDFEINRSKYGFSLYINNIPELIYFDPVFAVKELEEYPEPLSSFNLRFRIQQVGLTTLNRKGNFPNYAEIYSVDLKAEEARSQNDKVFADAIFPVEKEEQKSSARKKKNTAKPGEKRVKESGEPEQERITKINSRLNTVTGGAPAPDLKTEPKSVFGKFLQKKSADNSESDNLDKEELMSLFKSPEPLKKFIESRQGKEVVLQLK